MNIPDSSGLEQIAALTLAHYDERAESFRDGTRDHDVSQNVDALLRHITAPSPYTILDFGCGPGRDLKTFSGLGHRAIGLDGSERFVRMACEESGCEVWHQEFFSLALPDGHFDAVFANASLFHVPRAELPRVLAQLYVALKPGGVLFCSNPHGLDVEGWNAGRYGTYHSLETWRSFMRQAGFAELEHFYRPAGLPREHQPWLASVWRRSYE